MDRKYVVGGGRTRYTTRSFKDATGITLVTRITAAVACPERCNLIVRSKHLQPMPNTRTTLEQSVDRDGCHQTNDHVRTVIMKQGTNVEY